MNQLAILGWPHLDGTESSKRVISFDAKVKSIALYHDFVIILCENGSIEVHNKHSGDHQQHPWRDHCLSQLKRVDYLQSVHFAELFSIAIDINNQIWSVEPYLERKLIGCMKVQQIACGMKHTLLKANDHAYVFGYGEEGQLGLGPEILRTECLVDIKAIQSNVRCVAASAYHSAIVTEPYGELYTFGNNTYGRLGLSDSESSIIYTPSPVESLRGLGGWLSDGNTTGVMAVDCGLWHTVVIIDQTCDVMGWGWNNFGQLGEGSAEGEVIALPRRLTLSEEKDFVQVKCGNRFTALLSNEKELFVMGELGPSYIPCLHRNRETYAELFNKTSNITLTSLHPGRLRSIYKFSSSKKRRLEGMNEVQNDEDRGDAPLILRFTWSLAYCD